MGSTPSMLRTWARGPRSPLFYAIRILCDLRVSVVYSSGPQVLLSLLVTVSTGLRLRVFLLMSDEVAELLRPLCFHLDWSTRSRVSEAERFGMQCKPATRPGPMFRLSGFVAWVTQDRVTSFCELNPDLVASACL